MPSPFPGMDPFLERPEVFQQGPQFSQWAIVSSPIRSTSRWKIALHPQPGQYMLAASSVRVGYLTATWRVR